MHPHPCPTRPTTARGATLIEVLVAILLLSFGLLTLGAMLGFATQAPRMSSYRATAANLAAAHIERVRANPTGFIAGSYAVASSYDGTLNPIGLTSCTYPNCGPAELAALDNTTAQRAVRNDLPAGGLVLTCDGTCSLTNAANLWILWLEPSTFASLNPANSDNCPAQAAQFNPRPRCLYVRFKI